jgi:predicted secreted Zn-dependent protease
MQRFISRRLRRFLTVPLALSLFLMAAPAMADVVRTVATKYYIVDGTKPASIIQNLKHSSPLNEGSKTYQANTRTDIRTTYHIEQRGGTCRITDVVVYLRLTYLYPKLKHSVDFETRKWWRHFYRQLEKHELIHGEISTKAAHELSDALEGLGPGKCSQLKGTAKARSRLIMEQMKKNQAAYDALTQHGFKQQRNMGKYP